MGSRMARRLVDAGHELAVWNRAPRDLAGARIAADPADAVRDVELVITMLSDELALRDVLSRAVNDKALYVDMSTVGRAVIFELAATRRFVDAPVSGSRGAAESGTLTVLCGGSDEHVAFARPVLRALGRVEHVGPLGSGAAMKLVINAIGAQQMIALTSALELASRLGLDRARTLDLVNEGPFGAPSFKLKRQRILERITGDPDFTIALWEKDQRLVLEEAARQQYEMPTVELARRLMQQAVSEGLAEADMSAVGEIFRRR